MPVNLREASLPVRRAVKEHGGLPEPPLTFIYFIQPVDGGPIKIGRADDPVARRAEIQVGNWLRLRLTRCVVAEAIMEARLHAVFAKLCVGGEWFRAHPALAAIAEAIPDPDPELSDLVITPSPIDPATKPTRMQEYVQRMEERDEREARRWVERVPPAHCAYRTITFMPDPDEDGWKNSSADVRPSEAVS